MSDRSRLLIGATKNCQVSILDMAWSKNHNAPINVHTIFLFWTIWLNSSPDFDFILFDRVGERVCEIVSIKLNFPCVLNCIELPTTCAIISHGLYFFTPFFTAANIAEQLIFQSGQYFVIPFFPMNHIFFPLSNRCMQILAFSFFDHSIRYSN